MTSFSSKAWATLPMACAFLAFAPAASADGAGHANAHGPIGAMGDHMHHAGEWMISYRFSHMEMSGNRLNGDRIAADDIAASVPNVFAAMPGQPPTLRIAPEKMTMNMHMFGMMYAPSDRLTLVAMIGYMDKDMTATTYQGGMGLNTLGRFSTESQGFGDLKLAGLVRLYDDEINHLHFNAGISLPTGSIEKRDTVLTPMNTQAETRLPYAMQLGSGTYDLMPGLTYTGRQNDWGWGAQYKAVLHLGDNSENYHLGDSHIVTAWAAYEWAPWISTSLRAEGETAKAISGRDALIMGPVQSANPANYGGEQITLFAGVNLLGQDGALAGHRLAVEVGLPVYQDLNGLQMDRDYRLTIGYQKAF